MTGQAATCASLVWRTRWIGDEPTVEDWASLSESDVARAASCTHPAAMTRFVATRALLRAAVVQLRPELVRATLVFEVTPTGRLEVAGHPDLAVSSSHTGTFAAAAVADDGPVGIDGEPLDRGQLPRPEAWLTPSELDGLARLDARASHEQDLHRLMLLHLWVAKEAALKAWPGPGSTTRRQIVISCDGGRCGESAAGGRAPGARRDDRRRGGGAAEPSRRGGGTAGLPRDAAWCGAGRAVVEPAVPWSDPDAPPRASAAPAAALHLDIDWYAIDDAYLVALAHRHVTAGAGTTVREAQLGG